MNRFKSMSRTRQFLTSICIGAAIGSGAFLAGCGADASDANVASQNISVAADQFEVPRQIVFVNGITDKYLLSIEGYCSIADDGNQLEVTCKTEDGKFVKHFLGLSDNVTYFIQQLGGVNVSVAHYRVIFKPSVIIPDIDFE